MVDNSSRLPLVVGVNGYARSGKDTMAALLVAEYGYRRVAFADRLKSLILALFPDVKEMVDAYGWDEAKERFSEPRQALQDVGDVTREHIYPDVWIDAAFSSVTDGERIVVSDVRFPEEADAVLVRGAALFRIERPGCVPANGHRSDTALDRYDRFDGVILNDSTIDVFHDRIRTALEEWSLVQGDVR